ncbi:MAG: hypothetical protein UV00_C0006G0036 [candidate division WWE3 bacterium GW2011_GWF1_42_14]|uniref:Uncharacterized protein n=2 Tax=Katanobacteria TaxID=422282 RepID=A0A0G1BMF8_UNCKA|nr:MAG: hypothetical protein UU92_C0002G0044 [candidate division WWE3 bacterium GW2011_GWA1_42_12]KKS34929.1 MAG: hypothetical protein UU97_C0004G0015 [candidate division WWE3 bacterium GW2011_GWD1_42_14]KKS38638.1 MAG: hypothetical protein UV00_C0006G0036 [candidate division WWE3 bacterium GW2011_GWF1_42_14]KKS40409.1 MAG: hypothetical protein UV03_C0007G0044 [candidate division WWE3 bacterium GW2011_GWE1_42_16]KKS66612.1 MAG: hypothetical protein UV35_C0011G0045 [candidate division WWE3 bacte
MKRLLGIFVVFLLVSILTFLILIRNFTAKNTEVLYNLFGINNTKSEDSAFEIHESAFVEDPDVGVVSGSSKMNNVAAELEGIFLTSGDKIDENLGKKYDRYVVSSVNGNTVTGALDNFYPPKELLLECVPEKTALFKNLNMEFVSSNFGIAEEIKLGDVLYIAKCVSENCDATGPVCILVRRVR